MHSKWFVGKIYFTVLVAVFCCGYHVGTPPRVHAASADMPSSLQGTIRVSGAWALYPMMVKWVEEFKKFTRGFVSTFLQAVPERYYGCPVRAGGYRYGLQGTPS